MEKFAEEVTIAGQTIQLLHDQIPLERCHLDQNNPRIRYRLQLEADGKKLEDVILSMPEVKALRRDIEKSGGLRERIIAQENGDGTWKIREGNCRTVCYLSLRDKNPKDPRWKKIPARILPRNVDEKAIAILLSDFHVAGKIKWGAHEKAGQVYFMANVLGMPMDDIAIYLRTSKSTVKRYLDAYALMVDRFLKIDNGKYANAGERKWSYFDELYKRKELKNELKNNPEFGDDFCRWVGDGRIPKPVNVRQLPNILQQPDARKKLEKGGTFNEVMKVLEAHEPEQVSDFFRLLKSVRDACTSEAQVGEVVRIRNDKVAQQKITDTYKALVGFMRLSGVEPPKA